MSTRSFIGIENPDKTVTAIYCHSDGYVSHNGVILRDHYSDPDKAALLISLGDISSLGEDVGEQHDFNNRPEGQVTAYHRDRGEPWESVRPKRFGHAGAYLAFTSQIAYLYRDGEWLVERDGEFVTVDEALMEQEENDP